jgi:hypothetical protein
MAKIPLEIAQDLKTRFGKNVASYLRKIENGKAYIVALNRRAQAFAIQGIPTPLVIMSDTILDCGGYWTNNLNLVAPLDVARCPMLLRTLARETGLDLTPQLLSGMLRFQHKHGTGGNWWWSGSGAGRMYRHDVWISLLRGDCDCSGSKCGVSSAHCGPGVRQRMHRSVSIS